MWRQAGRALHGASWTGVWRALVLVGLAIGGDKSGESAIRVEADDTGMPATVRAGLFEDAARLAAREVMAAPGAERSSQLPVERIATFYDALVRVRSFEHPARDSVVTLYDIRTYPNPTLHRVYVGVARDLEWTAAWSRGMTLTGQPEIDALVHAYGLELEFFSRFPTDQRAVLFAPAALDIEALAERFAAVAGVEFAEPFAILGDGNDIRANHTARGLVLEYSVGFGDCSSGCRNRHTWRFLVDGAGGVSYIGAGGPTPPAAGKVTD